VRLHLPVHTDFVRHEVFTGHWRFGRASQSAHHAIGLCLRIGVRIEIFHRPSLLLLHLGNARRQCGERGGINAVSRGACGHRRIVAGRVGLQLGDRVSERGALFIELRDAGLHVGAQGLRDILDRLQGCFVHLKNLSGECVVCVPCSRANLSQITRARIFRC
jgi:hypothetical protein